MLSITTKLVFLTVIGFVGITGLFTTGAIYAPDPAASQLLRPAIVTPTATVVPCQADVSLMVVPAGITTTVGDTFIVTVTQQTSPTSCFFATYDLTLNQDGDHARFLYSSPQKVGPPVSFPVTFTLTASDTGTITFSASGYGEYNPCGPTNFCWQWSFINGASSPVTVTLGERAFYFPFVQKH